jgi:Flp pilus assembly protein TadG
MTLRTSRFARRIRSGRGATLIEAAFITPLLLLLTFSIVDFGSVLYIFMALENGVSQGTRYAVTGANPPSMTREDALRQAVRQATPTLYLPDGYFAFDHLVPGGTVWQSGPGGEDDIGRVTVTYPWTLMTPLMRPFFPSGRINIGVQSSMKNEKKFS